MALAVGVEQVVGVAGLERELADGDAAARRDVHRAMVLNDPAAIGELGVDLSTSVFFGSHPASLGMTVESSS